MDENTDISIYYLQRCRYFVKDFEFFILTEPYWDATMNIEIIFLLKNYNVVNFK